MYMISSIGPELDIIVDKATVSRESALQMASIRGPILRSGPGAKVLREAAPGVVLVLTNQGRGSGVVLSQQGEIITNWHVIDGAKWIGVFLKPPAGQPLSPSFYEARLVRIDQIADLALIQLRHAPSNLTALPLGDGRSIEVGSSVHAIGHPEGAYWTYTQGVISQVRADYRWTGDDKVQHVATVVQTQTPINPGNSGGPLLDDNANVIGVNSFRAPGNEGLNFAIGVDEIKRFLRTSASRVAENSTDVSLRPPEHVSTCEPRAFASFTDASIRKKVVPLDTQCRGYPNLYLIGERPGGSAEYALIDRIGDGKIDIRIIFGFGSGVDLWVVYGRRDGVPTAFGYDHGGKGKPDQFIAVVAGQQ